MPGTAGQFIYADTDGDLTTTDTGKILFLKLKDAFKLAMNDMTDELCLAWKPINDYIIDNTLQDLAVKFSNNLIEHDRVLYYNVD